MSKRFVCPKTVGGKKVRRYGDGCFAVSYKPVTKKKVGGKWACPKTVGRGNTVFRMRKGATKPYARGGAAKPGDRCVYIAEKRVRALSTTATSDREKRRTRNRDRADARHWKRLRDDPAYRDRIASAAERAQGLPHGSSGIRRDFAGRRR